MSLIEALVDAFELGADRRRADHAAMQHAGHAEVLHVGETSRHFVRDIDARHRLADDLVVLGVLAGGGFAVVELERERLAADQLAVADAFVAGTDDAVGDPEFLLLGTEALGRFVEKRGLGRRRRVAQLHAADLDGEAAPGRALVGRERSVALDELDHGQRHVELLGDHLQQRSRDAGAEVDLAGIDRHHALGIDREEGVDLGGCDRLARALCDCLTGSARKREADDQGAAALEHVASGSMNGHGCLPHALAARLTALTMRACVPQRHRLLASASLTCASVGFLFFVRNAADSMIMPLMQ